MKVTGILLAAGASRRMGRDKLIISLGGRTVLRCSAEALLNAGVTDIIIAVSDATRRRRRRFAHSMVSGPLMAVRHGEIPYITPLGLPTAT